MSQSQGFHWPDLSHYGIRMNIFTKGANTRLLTISGDINADNREKIERIGFSRMPWGTFVLGSSGGKNIRALLMQEFPETRIIPEGATCSDGSIMSMSDVYKDLNNPEIVRTLGDPLEGTPPEGFANEAEKRVIRVRRNDGTVYERGPRTPRAPRTPVAETNSEFDESNLVNYADFPEASNPIVRRVIDSARAGGVISRIPEGESEDNYLLVYPEVSQNNFLIFPRENNITKPIGWIKRTDIISIYDSGIKNRDEQSYTNYHDTRLFSKHSSERYRSSRSFADNDVEQRYVMIPVDNSGLFSEVDSLSRKIDYLKRYYVKRIVDTQAPIPSVYTDNIINFINGKQLGSEISDEERQDFARLVSISIGYFSKESANAHTKYRNLSILASLDRSRNVNEIPAYVRFAVARSMQITDAPSEGTIHIVNDDSGIFASSVSQDNLQQIAMETSAESLPLVQSVFTYDIDKANISEFPIQTNNVVRQFINLSGRYSSSTSVVELNGRDIEMKDTFVDILSYIHAREDDGQSTFIVDGSIEETQELIDYLAQNYMLNGIAFIPAVATSRTDGMPGSIVLSVGVKRREPVELDEISSDVRAVSISETPNDFWIWSSSVIARRAENNQAVALTDGVDRTFGDVTANDFQEPYGAMSKIGTPNTMVPKFQTIPMRKMQRLVMDDVKALNFEDVDSFVSERLGLTLEEMAGVLSPEQVDMAAIAFTRMTKEKEDGNAVMIADNTGVGKTRENICIARHSLLKDQMVVYFTEYGASFGAIYGEFEKLKAHDMARILTVNNQDIVDKVTKEIIIPATPRHIIKGLTSRNIQPNCNERMESIILKHSASAHLKSLYNDVLENYKPDMTDEEREYVESVLWVKHRTYGNQVTLVGDETDELLMRFIGEEDIRERHVDYPNYNVIFSSYSQVNRPSVKTQIEKGRMSYENYRLQLASGVSFSKKPKFIVPNLKSNWMASVVGQMPNLTSILDECHIACSDASNISENIMPFTHADTVVYSSATWLKSVKGMKLYHRIFPKEMPVDKISTLMTEGDETIHETITRMMVESRAYIRRELDTSGCVYNTVSDDKYFWENVEMVNAVSRVMSAISILSGDINARVSTLNEMIGDARETDAIMAAGGTLSSKKKEIFETESVGSPLARMESTLNLIYIHKMLIDRAVEHMQEGRKPFITISGTNENYVKRFHEKNGRMPNIRDMMKSALKKVTQVKHGGEVIDFSHSNAQSDMIDNLHEAVIKALPEDFSFSSQEETLEQKRERKDRIMALITESGEDNICEYIYKVIYEQAQVIFDGILPEEQGRINVIEVCDSVRNAIGVYDASINLQNLAERITSSQSRLPPNPGRAVNQIAMLIDEVPAAPISIIDEIKNGIRKAGFTIGEITGRRFEFVDGEPVVRDIRAKEVLRDEFNEDRYKALIVNEAAASSLDMQDFNGFGTRVTQFCGTQPNAGTFAQLAGRTNRNGQCSMPWYETYNTGMPVTRRELSILYSKLRSMFALSTSNRNNSFIAEDCMDLVNVVGDEIVYEYLSERPSLALKLGYKDRMEDASYRARHGKSTRGVISAHRVIKTIDMVLPFHEQSRVMKEIEVEYLARIEELNAAGMNPLKPEEIPGESRIVSKRLISGYESDEDTSVFAKPLYMAKVESVTEHNSISINEVVKHIERYYQESRETPKQRADTLWERRDEILYDAKGLDKSIHVDDYFVTGSVHSPSIELTVSYGKLKSLCEFLRNIEVGCEIKSTAFFTDVYTRTAAYKEVLVNMRMPDIDSNEATAAHHYFIESVSPNSEKILVDRLSGLMRTYTNNCTHFSLPHDCSLTTPETAFRSENPEKWMESYAEIARKAGRKTTHYHNILIGNELSATDMVLRGKFGNTIVFHLDTGPVRGVIIKNMEKFNEMIVSVESPELATSILFDGSIGALNIGTKPESMFRKMKKNGYKISLPASEDFFSAPSIVNFAEAHFGSIEEMMEKDQSGDKVKNKFVIKTEDEAVVSDLLHAMWRMGECSVATKFRESVAAKRQEMVTGKEAEAPDALNDANAQQTMDMDGDELEM